MINLNDILRDHVTLEVECIDRLYLNAYMPGLQTSGALGVCPSNSFQHIM
jgi:hypothetical protein